MADRFVGSKNGHGTWQRIICWMPPHDFYIEPFAGRAAVWRHKRPAARSVLIDLDPGALDAIADVVAHTDAAALPGDPNGPAAGVAGRPQPSAAVAPGRYRTEMIRGDGLDYLLRFRPPAGQRVQIYCDPPYPRESRRDVGRDYYRHDWDEAQHISFLAAIRRLPAAVRVLVSSYWSELYARALVSWHTDSFEVRTRGGPAIERLWANYPRPTRLHDYRYIGQDYQARWRIHKRQRSWCKLLRAMPEQERRAMLAVLTNEFGEG